MRPFNYAKERQQFDKPIIANQGISFKLADMATHVEAARLLTYQAAWLETMVCLMVKLQRWQNCLPAIRR